MIRQARTGGISAAWRDSTNLNRERRLPSGWQPFARLRSAAAIYSRATEFLAEIERKVQLTRIQIINSTKPARNKPDGGIKALPMFQADPIYGGDLH